MDIQGVRIVPSTIEFQDVEVGKKLSLNVSVKNIARESKKIRFYGPQQKIFKLKVKEYEKVVASGLEHTARVECLVTSEKQFEDRLIVTVDGEVVEVPISCSPCRPHLTMQEEVNFGIMAVANKVVSREIPVMNHGSRPGGFKVAYPGLHPLTIIPSVGQVPAHTAQMIRVEYVTKEVGPFDELAMVEFDGREPSSLRICGQIVERRLQLLSEKDESTMECITFGPTYYGTDRMESAILFNNAPEPIDFVVILEEDAVGQEAGSSLFGSKTSQVDVKACTNPLTSLVTMIPNQGRIGPYQKIPVFFRFSPRWSDPRQAFKATLSSPPRQDFALFMHVQMVGSNTQPGKADGFSEGAYLEIAVTGTALPVRLSVKPSSRLEFGECPVNNALEGLCSVHNESSIMPVHFQFQKVAHFCTFPDSGLIVPGESQDVLIRFQPRQYGDFKIAQNIDIRGVVGDSHNPFITGVDVIHTETITYTGRCLPESKLPESKFNAGITPLISNEVGVNTAARFDSPEMKPRMAMIRSSSGPFRLHLDPEARFNRSGVKTAFIAFPNDRTASIRPTEPDREYRTIMKRTKRYQAIDPDYAYDPETANAVRDHKNSYEIKLKTTQENRRIAKRDKRLQKFENGVDLGMVPGSGASGKKLTQDDVHPDSPPPIYPNDRFKLLSTKGIAESGSKVTKNNTIDGLNAIPTTDEEKADCRLRLSPQQLHQVVIEPHSIDFGRVCLRSVSTTDLKIVNNLNQYIHLVVEIDCRELRQSSPLSQVIPPRTKAAVPLIFESNMKGRFQRNINYTINGYYRNHIIAFAEVVPVGLEMSTQLLEVSPCVGQPAEAGIRGVITLFNRLNYPAEFTWEPIFKASGTAFSIRPKTGVVDAFSDLDCEVVFHPSFNAPEDGEFDLNVSGGATHRLKCQAKLGTAKVCFVNRRIMFGYVPLHLTTVKTAVLQNTSQCHAYFRVIDPNPYPGMSVSPLNGVVPVGGQAELKVSLTPSAVSKFDCCVKISIRGGRELELRMGGSVSLPEVEILQRQFAFGGVYVGSTMSLPFSLINKTPTNTRVEFDLTRFRDFRLSFPGHDSPEEYTYNLMNPGMYSVVLKGDENLECQLHLTPTEVASYDFYLPVIINNLRAPSPSPTPLPPTPAPSLKDSIALAAAAARNPALLAQTFEVATPRRHVTATALRQPLQVSHRQLEFSLSSEFAQHASSVPVGGIKVVVLINNSDRPLPWCFDLSNADQDLELGIFKFVRPDGSPFTSTERSDAICGTLQPEQTVHVGVCFAPVKPGRYRCKVPLIVHNCFTNPYDYLEVIGELKAPRLLFDPPDLVLTPVSLNTEISARFVILGINYFRASQLRVEYPELESDDGTRLQPLRVSFIDKPEMDPPEMSEANESTMDESTSSSRTLEVKCKVFFKSNRPISFTSSLVFVDQDGNSASLPVTATADNCILTCYPFMDKHRVDYHIVCEEGKLLEGRDSAAVGNADIGEAQLMPRGEGDAPTSRPSTVATSSNFEVSSSSYGDTLSETESPFPSTPREGAVNKPRSKLTSNLNSRTGTWHGESQSRMSRESDPSDGTFHVEITGFYQREVLAVVQRWFTTHGWAGGQFPIVLPDSLRSGLTRKPVDEEERKVKEKAGGSWDLSGAKSEVKTLYDMITHLCGRPAPGIPISAGLPSDPAERVKQIYWQHSTLLTFIRSQGGCLSGVRPEYLMEPKDYKLWRSLHPDSAATLPSMPVLDLMEETQSAIKSAEEAAWEEEMFEGISRRAWTDVLLQVLKTLVLYKVTPRSFRTLSQPDQGIELPDISGDPLASNVYTVNERIILAWLNHYYEHYRGRVWGPDSKGGVPAARWVINFDYDLLDGLVLAAVLGAHMPFLVDTHLKYMYTRPSTPEQCLHNALKVVNSMRFAGLDFDLQALDITDPQPIMLLMLCVYLYHALPQYIPKSTVEFVSGLHETATRQVSLSNPSGKSLLYRACIAGRDARDFTLPKGDSVSVPAKGSVAIPVQFRSRFLRPAEAVLLLIGRRTGSNAGATTIFSMCSHVDSITPVAIERVESPCYELHSIHLAVRNPFDESGTFRVVLVESETDLLNCTNQTLSKRLANKRRKKVKARVDHGQNKREEEEDNEEEGNDENASPLTKKPTNPLDEASGSSLSTMLSFFCHTSSLELPAGGTVVLEVNFLPFQCGKKQCSVVFVNERIGEFLHSIEASATLPLPTAVPYSENPTRTCRSARISSAAAASRGQGVYGGDDNIVYWRGEVSKRIDEVIEIPVVNRYKERALLLAAQQHLSDLEVSRRRITGTLDSSSLVNKAVDMLTVKKNKNQPSFPIEKKYDRKLETMAFRVELDSPYFNAPEVVFLPHPARVASAPSSVVNTKERREQLFELPVSFCSKNAGLYSCNVTLKGPDDVRVHRIECLAVPEGSHAELLFNTPVHQPVMQNIPIVNQTNHDWPLRATLRGNGFFGPDSLLVKSHTKGNYPLTFKPMYEGDVDGSLLLSNQTDGTEHNFILKGEAKKPLALDNLAFECSVHEKVNRTLLIPNVTRRKLVYEVESDLPFVSGKRSVTVLPGRQVEYQLAITPDRRGRHKGVVAFVAGKRGAIEYDSDGDEIPPFEDEAPTAYRVWYGLTVDVSPAPPQQELGLSCPCQQSTVMELALTNPADEAIELEAQIYGDCLTGPSSVLVEAKAHGIYELTYTPEVIGNFSGSLILYHPLVGELWYALSLRALEPPITTVEPLECELGRWQMIDLVLENPSPFTLHLDPMVSNKNNFMIRTSNLGKIVLEPHATMKIPVRFTPSDLGFADHNCVVIFHSKELGEWKFELSGCGLLPSPRDPVCVTTSAGTNTTLLIPFHNPLDVFVLVEVLLHDHDQLPHQIATADAMEEYDSPEKPRPAFCLLLKHHKKIKLGPKATLDIPISFAPETMRQYEALCTVVMRKRSGSAWEFSPGHPNSEPRAPASALKEIRWLYPIRGVPESTSSQAAPPVIEGRARALTEQRVELWLAGVAPAPSAPQQTIRARQRSPQLNSDHYSTTDEGFHFELTATDDALKGTLADAVNLTLLRQHRDSASGLIVLTFNVVFRPFRTFDCTADLLVRSAAGGVWRYPVVFLASDPEPDDVITIHATGLNKETTVQFRLNSQDLNTAPFRTFFDEGSSSEFSVLPQSGELPPNTELGTPIQVTFHPAYYGKPKRARLIVQTPDMEWTYMVIGESPVFEMPRGVSSQPMAGPHPDPRRRGKPRNFIRENMKLISTAVSAPVKGASILPRL